MTPGAAQVPQADRTASHTIDATASKTGTRAVSWPEPADLARNGTLLAVLWFAYALVRSATDHTAEQALSNSHRLLAIQDRLGFAIEADLQSWINVPAAFVAANVYYLVHFPITIMIVIASLLRDRDESYVVLRNSLIAVTGVALLVHLAAPLAPPRMLPGYLDTGTLFGPDPYSMPGSDGANQFAAMPSMHVAWAVLTGWTMWSLNHFRWLRAAGLAHPVITVAVVVVTGHHFLADVIVGGMLAIGAIALFTRLNHGTRTDVGRRTDEHRTDEHRTDEPIAALAPGGDFYRPCSTTSRPAASAVAGRLNRTTAGDAPASSPSESVPRAKTITL